jgi:hypothetical protein
MSEAEVAGDVAGASSEKTRTLAELIELARRREEERGFSIRLDDDYAADIEQVVRERKPWTPRSWE